MCLVCKVGTLSESVEEYMSPVFRDYYAKSSVFIAAGSDDAMTYARKFNFKFNWNLMVEFDAPRRAAPRRGRAC